MKTSLRIWCSIKWYPHVWWFSFFLSHCCSVDCELVLLREIRNWSILSVQILSLIQSFKPTKINDHPLIPCWTINHFFLFSFPTEIWPKVNRKEEYKNGREKEGRENGNVNRHTTEQPSKKRKEDFSESKSEVKKPSPEKKKVCKPFDYHTLLLQN